MTSVRASLIGLTTLLFCRVVVGAEPPEPSTTARARFEAGIAAVSRGELERGLHEFEAAYALQPRYAVLFNIGQAQAALGRPLEAIASFERFLTQGGQQISEARRAEVVRLIEQNRRLTGALVLKVEAPTETRVWLDGKPLSNEQLTKPMPLLVGEHALLYSQGRGFPSELKVRVEPEQATEVVISAAAPEPHVASAPAAPSRGYLAVTCKVAGLDVEVAGKPVGRTPLAAPVGSGAGRVSVKFARAGYEPVVREVSVLVGATSTITCSLPLTPTRASIERREAAARRRIVGYGLAGAAVASLGASAAIYGWNQGRYDDWRDARTDADPMVDRAVSIQRADDAAIGLIVLGAGLSALATWTLLATD